MNVSHLLHPVELTGVVHFSAVQRIIPFHRRDQYLGLKMWILLSGIRTCNSKGICSGTCNEGGSQESITGLLWQWVCYIVIAQHQLLIPVK